MNEQAIAIADRGTNTMIIGPTGAGKTTAILSLIDAGITPFVLATEPGVNEILSAAPKEKLHWHYVSPSTQGWDDMIDGAKMLNTMSLKVISGMAGIHREKFQQFIEVYSTFANFKCDRTGESYGAVDTWNTDRAIVLDSLSGTSIMAMNLIVGSKPVKSLPDWGVAMGNLRQLIEKLCFDTRCHFIMTTHAERVVDEVTGAVKIMASTLGKKLAPELPRFFSDVIYAYREKGKYYWSTESQGIDTKSRNLPLQDKLQPSFIPLISAWQKKGGKIEETKIP